MEEKVVSPATRNIQNRFFEALDQLKNDKKIEGIKPFCAKYGLVGNNYIAIKNKSLNPDLKSSRKFISIDAIYYLVKDYKVSADWLLTGKGKPFK